MNTQLIDISSILLLIAFFLYLAATIMLVVSVTGRKMSGQEEVTVQQKWGRIGFIVTAAGFVFQSGFFVLRWIGQGHTPVSSMFEFMSFLAMMAVLGYVIIYMLYRMAAVGAFVLPIVLAILGWAAVFDTDPQPLVPALQSYWLTLHVSTVAIGEGLLAVGFAAGFMYLIRTVDQKRSTWQTKIIEMIFYSILSLCGFIILSMTFSALDYEVSFEYLNEQGNQQVLVYELPAIAGPHEGVQLTEERMSPLFKTPSFFQGVDAPRKFNTMIWSLLAGLVFYLILRLVLRRRLGQLVQPWLQELKPAMLDEVSYRAIAIAFPIFTLGALVFAMIWAEEAWGRFWGWDPKEVWALITWLFYAAYLHLRLSQGWHGRKSAWLAVIGFIIVMFNLVVVNLIIAGLHSYV